LNADLQVESVSRYRRAHGLLFTTGDRYRPDFGAAALRPVITRKLLAEAGTRPFQILSCLTARSWKALPSGSRDAGARELRKSRSHRPRSTFHACRSSN
jgi:hypothetical protein